MESSDELPAALRFYQKEWQKVVLDPLFWQSLQLSLECNCGALIDLHVRACPKYDDSTNEVEIRLAIKFCKLILTNGDTETFWKQLLAS